MAARSPYGSVPERGPDGMAPRLLELFEQLRAEGVAVGTAQALDAFSALDWVPWTEPEDFREALAATLAKSQDERQIFEAVFDRFFFRSVEAEAVRQELGEASARGETGEIDLDALRRAVREAIAEGDEARMRDLARLAIAALGRQGEGSGVIGVDVQRIRRRLDLQTGRRREGPDSREDPGATLDRESLNRFERHVRRELEGQMIERTSALPPARPLAEIDRSLPSSPTQDLASVHRAVTQLKRRLATLGHVQRGHRPERHVDMRRTLRASLSTGGVPLSLRFRPRHPRRPEIYVLCDVSTSVTSASVFFLSVLHALHDAFRKLRSFVFIERISEVTDVFEHERDFRAVSERIAREGGVADVSGYTDYGRVWSEFVEAVTEDLGPRSTVIVLGDARTNGRDPRADLFARVAERAGRTFWLNPEPALYWNYGDSVMDAYIPYLDGAFECWTTKHLERFVDVVAGAAQRAD